NAVSLSGPLGLLDAVAPDHDRVYFLELTTTNNYATIASVASHSITMDDGQTTPATGGLTINVQRDRCVRVMSSAGGRYNRIKSAAPDVGNGIATWQLRAAPARDRGFVGTLMLGSETTAPAMTTSTMATFVNPYPGTLPVATSSVAATTSYAYVNTAAETF